MGELGEKCEKARAMAACRCRTPEPHVGSSGPTDLLSLLLQDIAKGSEGTAEQVVISCVE